MKSSTSSVNPICEMNRCFSQPKHEMSDNSPHPDYLGNTGFITDITGRPYQHFFYSPFGEELVSQHAGNGNYDSPYRFNAKEVDPETGYHYYGARYYNSNLSMWISVDPLADKYPSLTPYAFVANNPVMLYDPDGMRIKSGMKFFNMLMGAAKNKIDFWQGKEAKLRTRSHELSEAGKANRAARKSKNADRAGNRAAEYQNVVCELNQLKDSEQDYSISAGHYSQFRDGHSGNISLNTETNIIEIKLKANFKLGHLAHEFKHAYQYDSGELSFGPTGKKGGALSDIYDEREAYVRGNLFGLSLSTKLSDMATKYPYAALTPRSMNSPASTGPNTSTIGMQLGGLLSKEFEGGKSPSNYFKGWENFYK